MPTIDDLYRAMKPLEQKLPFEMYKRSTMSGSFIGFRAYFARATRSLVIYYGDDDALHAALQETTYMIGPRIALNLANLLPYFPLSLFIKKNASLELLVLDHGLNIPEQITRIERLAYQHLGPEKGGAGKGT